MLTGKSKGSGWRTDDGAEASRANMVRHQRPEGEHKATAAFLLEVNNLSSCSLRSAMASLHANKCTKETGKNHAVFSSQRRWKVRVLVPPAAGLGWHPQLSVNAMCRKTSKQSRPSSPGGPGPSGLAVRKIHRRASAPPTRSQPKIHEPLLIQFIHLPTISWPPNVSRPSSRNR